VKQTSQRELCQLHKSISRKPTGRASPSSTISASLATRTRHRYWKGYDWLGVCQEREIRTTSTCWFSSRRWKSPFQIPPSFWKPMSDNNMCRHISNIPSIQFNSCENGHLTRETKHSTVYSLRHLRKELHAFPLVGPEQTEIAWKIKISVPSRFSTAPKGLTRSSSPSS
jgi:hypothetical protein